MLVPPKLEPQKEHNGSWANQRKSYQVQRFDGGKKNLPGRGFLFWFGDVLEQEACANDSTEWKVDVKTWTILVSLRGQTDNLK